MIPCLLALSQSRVRNTAVINNGCSFLFGFQTAIGNIQTLPSDLFSGKTVGTLSGFAGMAANYLVQD